MTKGQQILPPPRAFKGPSTILLVVWTKWIPS